MQYIPAGQASQSPLSAHSRVAQRDLWKAGSWRLPTAGSKRLSVRNGDALHSFQNLAPEKAGRQGYTGAVSRPRYRLRLPRRELVLGERTLVMGILNVTPDSFSDGGLYLEPEQAVARAREIERQGADLLDVGAESTRPGSARISEADELARLLPVLEGLHGRVSLPISVDTYKPVVAERAVAAGAELINFPALRPVAEMARVAGRAGVPLVAMHLRGTPDTMHLLPPLEDVVGEVLAGLRQLRDQAWAAGLQREALILDPGFGFGKNGDENYTLLARFGELHQLRCPLLAGTSRKSFIGGTLGLPAHQRIWGTAATVAAAIFAGAHIVRVHDATEIVQVVRVSDRIRGAAPGSPLPG